MRRKWILLAPLVVLAGLLFVAIGGEIVRQLWNWLLPTLFGWPRITFWQALGILALSRILFGGSGFHGSGRSRMRHRMAGRCESMTPEEKKRFRQRMRERWGFGSPSGGSVRDAAGSAGQGDGESGDEGR
jgi:hypothetical protein